MKYVNITLSTLAAFVAAGTGWAIYTGATTALGMAAPVALIVALAIIALDIEAGLLITDIKRFNQAARNQTERDLLMPIKGAWLSLGFAIVTEITLSLLVVVLDTVSVWGVLVFPPMTLSAIFVNSLRLDLAQREAEREETRLKASNKRTAKPPKPAIAEIEPAIQQEQTAFVCSCGKEFGSQPALNAHQRKHKPIPIDKSLLIDKGEK